MPKNVSCLQPRDLETTYFELDYEYTGCTFPAVVYMLSATTRLGDYLLIIRLYRKNFWLNNCHPPKLLSALMEGLINKFTWEAVVAITPKGGCGTYVSDQRKHDHQRRQISEYML